MSFPGTTSPARTRRGVPATRIRPANAAPVAGEGEYVLCWMLSNRRLSPNGALDRAVEWARHLGKPLVLLESLRCGYRRASDRIQQLVPDGMAEHQYARDGRAPSSYAGIFWVLGRCDRSCGSERPAFGKVRFMSSGNMARKLRTDENGRRRAAPA